MKKWSQRTGFTAAFALCFLATSSFADTVRLRLLPSTNAVIVTADPISEAGALFVFQAPNLPSLTETPAICFQANTPGSLWLPVEQSDQSYFFAVHWPGVCGRVWQPRIRARPTAAGDDSHRQWPAGQPGGGPGLHGGFLCDGSCRPPSQCVGSGYRSSSCDGPTAPFIPTLR